MLDGKKINKKQQNKQTKKSARWAYGWPAVIESHACVNMAAICQVISDVFGHPEGLSSTKSVFPTEGKGLGP